MKLDDRSFVRERQRALANESAAARDLVERLGREGVDWLDRFLDDYVFRGEPLDRVIVKARTLARLPPRADRDDFDD